MTLEEYSRTKYYNYIRPLYIKNKCDICDSEENLELHHVKQFSELLKDTLKDLNLSYKDFNLYSNTEIKNINNVMLGKQIKCKYKTLCSKCHDYIHTNNLIFSFKNNYKCDYRLLKIDLDYRYIGIILTPDIKREMVNLYMCNCSTRDRSWQKLKYAINNNNHKVIVNNKGTFIDYLKEEKEINNTIDINYISSFIGAYMEKSVINDFVKTLNIRDNRKRLLKSINSINNYFMNNNIDFNIISKVIKKDSKSIRVWIVNKN